MNKEKLEIYFKFSRICKARRVPADVELEWVKVYNAIQTDTEQEEYLKQKIEYVEAHYPEIPMEQYLMEIDESCNWDDLRYYENVYWPDMLTLCKDAVRLGAGRVVEQVAPHLLFANEELLRELLNIAPDGIMQSILEKCMIPRHDADYVNYAFAAAYNEEHWHYKQEENAILISLADGIQQALYRAYINKTSHGSELLYFEYATTGEYVSEPITARNLYPESYEMYLHDLGYKLTDDGIEKADLQKCWMQNERYGNQSEKMKVSRGISDFFSMMHFCKWNVEFDGVRNHFGYTGYRYVKSIPDIKECVSAEDCVLKLFYSAFNGKIAWKDLTDVMSESCHYYSDGSKKDIIGREAIIDFWESVEENQKAEGLTQHAHYARLKKPVCDPELLEHKEGERIIAIWQGELGEWYDGHLFFRLNDDGLVDDIYLCQDNRYRFRPFIPKGKEE